MAKATRTQKEIDAQIEGLKRDKKNLPKNSMFGDDNHGKIDAQIAVLQGEKSSDDYWVDETADEYEDGDNDIYFAACDAEEWLAGNRAENLFDE